CRRSADARRRCLPEGAPPAGPLPARDAAQPDSPGKHAARARRRRNRDARNAGVLLRPEDNRRHGRAVRLPSPRANWPPAGKAISLGGGQVLELLQSSREEESRFTADVRHEDGKIDSCGFLGVSAMSILFSSL